MNNICYIIWKFKSPKNFVNMGGAENQLLKIIKRFKDTNKEITIITRKTDEDSKFELYSSNIKIYRIFTTNIKYISMLFFMFGLFFLIINLNRKRKFDIIHMPLPDFTIMMVYALRWILNIPVLTMVASDELHHQRLKDLWRISRLIVRFFMLRLDGIQTLNPTAYNIAANLGYEKEKIFLVPMGLEIPAIYRDYKDFKNNIIFVGYMRFSPEKKQREIKNLDFLIEAFYDLVKKNSKLKLIMVGDGNYREKLETKVIGLNLQEKVIFVGYQTDVYKYLLNADIFVNPSLSEGMPNAVIEAMSCGIYTICSDIPGHRFIIKNRKTGILFNNESKEELIVEILNFYKQPEVSKKIAQNSRLYAIKQFSMDSIIKKILDMYKKVRLRYLLINTKK